MVQKNVGLVCGDRLCSEDEPTPQSSSSLPEVTEEEVSNDSQRFLEIKGDPVTNGTIIYQVVVTGQIFLGPHANPSRDMLSTDGTAIDGMILPTGLDDYYFTGNIVSITADQNVFSFVDGVEIITQVIPEFGTIAVMILGIAIISIIAVTSRSKVIPRF